MPALFPAKPGDHGGEDAGEFGADQQEPFLVFLRRDDLQQGHDLAGAEELIGHQREVRDLQQFLQPHAGMPERLDDGPGPERLVLVTADVELLCRGYVLDQHHLRPVLEARLGSVLPAADAAIASAFVVEELSDGGGLGSGQ